MVIHISIRNRMSTSNVINPEQINLQKEYEVLRDEIIKLKDLRHRMIFLAITILGLLLSFGTTENEIRTFLFLLYPWINYYIAKGWTHYDCRLGEIGLYIKEYIEPNLAPIYWEQYIFQNSKEGSRHFRGQESSAHGMLSAFNLISIIVAVYIFIRNISIEPVFVSISTFNLLFHFILFLVSIYFLFQTHKIVKERRKNLNKNQTPQFISIQLHNINNDLSNLSKGYRKILVTKIKKECENRIVKKEWIPPNENDHADVLEMRDTELAYFNQNAKQDQHYHIDATEIYTVIEGQMVIELNNQSLEFKSGDTIIVNPKTPHFIKSTDTNFLCQVLSVNSHGITDKKIIV